MALISQSSPCWTLAQGLTGWTIKLYLSIIRLGWKLRKFHLIHFSFTYFQTVHLASLVYPRLNFLGHLHSLSIFSFLLFYADDTRLYLPLRSCLKGANPPVAQGFRQLKYCPPAFQKNTAPPTHSLPETFVFERHPHTAPVQAALSLTIIIFSNLDRHHVITETPLVPLLELTL